MDEAVSFTSGMALLVMGLLVMRAYWPVKRPDRAAWFLAAAIFLGFTADVINTIYWQILFKIAQWSEWELSGWRTVGNYMDSIFKGGAALAGYLHLRALWLRLPLADRDVWHPVEMPWYPRRRMCISLLSRKMGLRKDDLPRK